jgi:TfoX/Sxy family transcriptional regulator of competence genes
MAWKKANQDLIDRLEEALAGYDADRRFMFGSPTFFVRNNMFAGVHQDTVILRLSEADRQALFAAHPDITLFTPMEGRPMKEYAALPYDFCEDRELLRELLEKSYRYAASLPFKAPRAPRKPK